MTTKQLYDIGETPPLGHVPKQMHAQVVRRERFGEPKNAFREEVVETPALNSGEVLVYVMAAGINYNNVWAARGVPVDVIKVHEKEGDKTGLHIGGSDASGVVWATGPDVYNVRVGDAVVLHCGQWDSRCPTVLAGRDSMFSPTFRIWGYESNWGSFAQFAKVQAHQCLPKPEHLTWEQAGAYMLVGATAYRMLCGWPEHVVTPGDAVLVWGASGGLGSQAIQIARARGGIPVGVISDDTKADFCQRIGAKGVVNRKRFSHWGVLPHWKDEPGMAGFLEGARAFGKAIWDVLGERKSPRIVFEHPGEDTIPTSIFVCDTGGMVAICAGTSGYNATLDLRYHWMRQKRLQGSHFANDAQAEAFNWMVIRRQVDPCLSQTFRFDQIGEVHQLMNENRHPPGNMAVLVGAPRVGLRELP